MKKIIFVSLMMMSILYPQNQKLTLQESLVLGLENSKDLKISHSKVIGSDAKVSEINSMFLPQLKFVANYTRLSDNVPPFEFTTPFLPVPVKISDPVLDNYNLKLSFQQPLFTGLRLLSSKKAANYNYSATELEYSKDKNEAAFNKSLGLPLEAPTEILAEDINVEVVTYNIEELLTEAKSNRDELESLEYKLKATNENITAAQSTWFPSIYLTGNFYYNNPNVRVQPLIGEWNDTWDAGVTLKWDLWSWGLTSSQTTQAEELAVQTRSLLEKTVDNIEVEVYQSYLNTVKSKEKVDVSRLGLEQASENYRITKEKYNEQLATSTDLIDAEVSELQAATNLKSALVDYEIAKTRLEKSLGRRIY